MEVPWGAPLYADSSGAGSSSAVANGSGAPGGDIGSAIANLISQYGSWLLIGGLVILGLALAESGGSGGGVRYRSVRRRKK